MQSLTFDEWMQNLNHIAGLAGQMTNQDRDAWREDYDAGKSPQQAWDDEWL